MPARPVATSVTKVATDVWSSCGPPPRSTATYILSAQALAGGDSAACGDARSASCARTPAIADRLSLRATTTVSIDNDAHASRPVASCSGRAAAADHRGMYRVLRVPQRRQPDRASSAAARALAAPPVRAMRARRRCIDDVRRRTRRPTCSYPRRGPLLQRQRSADGDDASGVRRPCDPWRRVVTRHRGSGTASSASDASRGGSQRRCPPLCRSVTATESVMRDGVDATGAWVTQTGNNSSIAWCSEPLSRDVVGLRAGDTLSRGLREPDHSAIKSCQVQARLEVRRAGAAPRAVGTPQTLRFDQAIAHGVLQLCHVRAGHRTRGWRVAGRRHHDGAEQLPGCDPLLRLGLGVGSHGAARPLGALREPDHADRHQQARPADEPALRDRRQRRPPPGLERPGGRRARLALPRVPQRCEPRGALQQHGVRLGRPLRRDPRGLRNVPRHSGGPRR
jgi:hypothetical protein